MPQIEEVAVVARRPTRLATDRNKGGVPAMGKRKSMDPGSGGV